MEDQGTNRASGGVRFRKLRIAWSVGCGIACVPLVVLWVRSYRWLEAPKKTISAPLVFSWDETRHGTVADLLPPSAEFAKVTITNETPPHEGAVRNVPAQDWPPMLSALSHTRPAILSITSMLTASIKIVTHDRRTISVWLYDHPKTGLVYFVYEKGSIATERPHFGATGKRELMLSLLPLKTQ